MTKKKASTKKQTKKPTGKVYSKFDAIGLPFKAGDCIFIRTVTHHLLGRVTGIGEDYFILEKASWIADSAVRHSVLLNNGPSNTTEIERCPDEWTLVGRGAVIDINPWKHALPEKTQ